jgi:hypothetical protein
VRTRATGRRCGRPRANAAFHATLELSAHHGLLLRAPDTTSYFGARSERRAARTAWWLFGSGRRAQARAAHQGGQAVWLGVQITEYGADAESNEDDEDEAGQPYVDDEAHYVDDEAQEAVDDDEDDDL